MLAASFDFALESKYGHQLALLLMRCCPPVVTRRPMQFVVKIRLVYQHPFTNACLLSTAARCFQLPTMDLNDAPTYVSTWPPSNSRSPTYYVLDDQRVNNGYAVLPDADRRWLLPGCGLLLAIVMRCATPRPKAGPGPRWHKRHHMPPAWVFSGP
jgi:hypothetical protein